VPVVLSAMLVLGVPAAAGSRSARDAQAGRAWPVGLLVTSNGSSLDAPKPDSGVWSVTLDGRLRQAASSRWRPLAVGRHGEIAATRAHGGAVTILRGALRRPLTRSRGAACVSWSADGTRLAYVTGTWRIITGGADQIGGWDGDIWIASRTAPSRPLHLARGFVLDSECPLWSRSGARLAYLVGRSGASASGPWTLTASDVAGRPLLSRSLDAEIPSTAYRTFDWAPTGQRIDYLDGDTLREAVRGTVRTLAGAATFTAIQKQAIEHGVSRLARECSISPDGSKIAVTVAGGTGLLNRDGILQRAFPGGFLGWSGNSAALAEHVSPRGLPALYRYSIGNGSGLLLAEHFKLAIVTDPAGRWFAYPLPNDRRHRLVVRRADGGVRRILRLPFIPKLLYAVGEDGRLAAPAGRY
jgi:dipeptidyl aminopeptidase/acylaminoacyl peptidase